jgi:hypothetical protein
LDLLKDTGLVPGDAAPLRTALPNPHREHLPGGLPFRPSGETELASSATFPDWLGHPQPDVPPVWIADNRGTIQFGAAMAEPITIPISNFELNIAYTHPVLNLWLDRAVIVQKMFDVFERWKLNVDDVEGITTGKTSEQGVKFKIPTQGIGFFFGAASCKFTKEAATWAGADETLDVLMALDVLVKQAGVELGKRATSLALHLQPKTLSFRELLRPFLPPSFAALENSTAEAMAYVVRWKERRITLDGSAAIANGVFVHLERDFEPTVSFEEMKTTIFKDEAAMLKLLNVEQVAA